MEVEEVFLNALRKRAAQHVTQWKLVDQER